jgi:hypothetical protein
LIYTSIQKDFYVQNKIIDNRVLSHFYDINGNFNIENKKSASKCTLIGRSLEGYTKFPTVSITETAAGKL